MSEMITVIIPVYNCKKYLSQAVNSALKQNYDNLNIVLVDDGSTDGSEKLCDEIEKSHSNIYVIHKENGGVSSARNAGLKFAYSKFEGYICFLDADDIWCPNVLSKVDFQDDVQMYVFNVINANEDMSGFSENNYYKKTQIEKGGADSIWKFQVSFASAIYSIDLIRKNEICFDENCAFCEDLIFRFQCSYFAEKVMFNNYPLYVYRYNGDSAMHKGRRKLDKKKFFDMVIKGWVMSDDFINSRSEEKTRSGRVLAGLTFVDMATEYLSNFGSLKKIQQYVENNPYSYCLYELRACDMTAEQWNSCQMFINRPRKFKYKSIVANFIPNILRRLLKVSKFANWLLLKKKYPLKEVDGMKNYD